MIASAPETLIDMNIPLPKLSAKNLEELLKFYIALAEGIPELRVRDDREKDLAPLIAFKLLHKSDENSDMYGFTTGYTITKTGKAAIDTVVDAFDTTASMLVVRSPSDSPPGAVS